tara:strand:+ start:298 stop:450 length:153 start_codon:yes stop_codon:yes gene_type:complete
LDDDIDALLLSHQMHSKERIKKERRGWKRLDPSLHDVLGQRGVIIASSSL